MLSDNKTAFLNVIVDTNIIFKKDSFDFLNNELKNFLKDYSKNEDVKIVFYIPEVVKHERLFQIEKSVNEEYSIFLSKLKKIKPYLNLPTDNFLIESPAEIAQISFNSEIHNNNINIFSLNYDSIDWHKIMLDSCYKKLPFENYQGGEKGFRDALIIESMFQLASKYSQEHSYLTLCLSSDKVLIQSLSLRLNQFLNIKIFNSISECRSFINILLSTQDEKLLNTLLTQAEFIFYNSTNFNSIFFKQNIQQKIKDNYNDILFSVPESDLIREDYIWNINKPVYENFDKDRIYFTNNIIVTSNMYKLGHILVIGNNIGDDLRSLRDINLNDYKIKSENREETIVQSKKCLGKYESLFKVKWSAKVRDNSLFENEIIEDISMIENEIIKEIEI